ncbi:MAG: tripartite tricarboxylate transporter substrate-binding protein, partial [Burkholderiales bacterium]
VKTAYLSPVVVAQLIKSGKLVALGVAGTRRIPILPEVPTLAEAGLPGVEAYGWNGLFVPAGKP